MYEALIAEEIMGSHPGGVKLLRRSTEVAFALLTQQRRVRFSEFPKLIEISRRHLECGSLNKSIEPSSTSPELVLQKKLIPAILSVFSMGSYLQWL